jgi:tRNA-dihydrouridine synthase
VSDLPFRRAASRLGAAYVATEMVACAELSLGRPDVVRRAAVGEGLPLMVIQLVGRDPAHIAAGAKTAARAGRLEEAAAVERGLEELWTPDQPRLAA